MAGIVPIGGLALDFKMPWNDCMMPISPNYLAIERAVAECAYAGCDTIWITGNRGIAPVVRKRLGDYIIDPISLNGLELHTRIKSIPIFYVPVHPKDEDRRDCLGWNVLYGADSAFRVGCFISKWVAPTRYYCAFPHGITSEEYISTLRLKLKRADKNIIFSYNGKTVKDNLHLSFTFSAEDYKKCRDIVKKKNIEDYYLRSQKDATLFTLSEVFEPLDIITNDVVELPWFYDIGSWQNYCDYMGSQTARNMKKREKIFRHEKRRIFPLEKEQPGNKNNEQKNRENLQQSTEQDQTKNESS